MNIVPTTYSIVRGSDLYLPLLKGFGGLIAVTYVKNYLNQRVFNPQLGGFTLCSAVFDYAIQFDPGQSIHNAFFNTWPDQIDFQIVQATKTSPSFDPTNTYQQLYMGQFENTFCMFYESKHENLVKKYGGKKFFPPEIQFCRIIRNGISHSNRINITDGLSGNLNGFVIDENSNGQSLTYNLVTQADYVFMMMLLAAA